VIILTAFKCDVDRCLKWGVFLSGIGAVAVIGWVVLLFACGPSRSEWQNSGSEKKMTKVAYLYPLDSIGSGPLSLRPKIACGWMSRIAEELSLISFNSRPDVLQKDAKILVAAQGGKEQMIIPNGKMLFLQERSEGKGLEFSESATALWAKPILLDNGSVLVEAGRKLISKEGALVGEEKGEFIASLQKSATFRHQEGQITCLSELKKGIYLGQDPLIGLYGGKEYAEWKDKVKLEFSSEGRTYAVFVGLNDFLQFKDKEWRFVPQQAIDPHLPLAQTVAVSSKGVELQAWDESGFFCVSVAVDAASKPGASGVTHDLLPGSLRMRSNTQVSCVLGKKRLILKKGDWLLKTAAGWRNLRRADEIEDCLFHRVKGELFIVDGIEKQQGKSVLQGHLFDPYRTAVNLIHLPIDVEKKGSQRPARKGKQL
jgi:hypothetical protein